MTTPLSDAPRPGGARHRVPRRSRTLVAAAIAVLTGLAGVALVALQGPGSSPGPMAGVDGAAPQAPATSPPLRTRPEKQPAAFWGPSPEAVAAATAVAADMSPEELAGQLIVGRMYGTDPAAARRLVAELHLAGVMMSGENVAGLDQVLAVSAGVHEAVAEDGRTWPALVSTDNEGGPVQRMSGREGPWTTFPPFAVTGRVADPAVIEEAYAAMAVELRASGITVNWAPVADVTVPGQEGFIGSRAAGADPAAVSQAVVAATRGLLAGGVLPSAKHFPGHGGLSDSHVGLPVLDAGRAQLRVRELPPFEDAVRAGVPMVMLGHVDVRAWDPGVPASLSPAAYEVLREELGFAGVTVTDSLGMGAVMAEGDAGEVAVAALDAGADLLLNPADNEAAHAGVVAAIEDGTLDRARLEAAAGRVIALLRHQVQLAERAGSVGPEDVGSAAEAAEALRQAARDAGEDDGGGGTGPSDQHGVLVP